MSHAFAMPAPLELTAEDQELLDRVAAMVVRRRLTTPATMFLEMGRPLNYVASQFMQFVQPFATMLLSQDDYARFAKILEHRQGVGALLRAISDAESARRRTPAAPGGAESPNNVTEPTDE